MTKIFLSLLILSSTMISFSAAAEAVKLPTKEEKSKQDNVTQVRTNNVVRTVIPMRDWWWSEKRKEAFLLASIFSEKLMKDWAEKTFSMRFPEQTDEQKKVQQLTAKQIRELIQASGQRAGMPTRAEILATAMDGEQVNKMEATKLKYLEEFDLLIQQFEKAQTDIDASPYGGISDAIIPSAFLFSFALKAPVGWLESIQKTRFSAISALLKGSIAITFVVRPTYFEERNLDTGVVTSGWDWDYSSQGWIFKDLGSPKAQGWENFWRIGTGFLTGDFVDHKDIYGVIGGYSINFNRPGKRYRADTSNLFPYYYNLKIGTITAVVESLRGKVYGQSFFKHGYLVLSRQSGFRSDVSRNSRNVDTGGVFNLEALLGELKVDDETLAEMTKAIAEVIPGASIILRDNSLEVKLPVKTKIPQKNLNLEGSKDPVVGPPAPETVQPIQDR